MTLPPSSDHFHGKNVVEHLKDARAKGAVASAEIHGTEMPGHLAAFADASKEMAFALLILWMVFSFAIPPSQVWIPLSFFSAGWLIWKTGRSALLGWARIERLHRVIEEERWEIEHHRAQEKAELTEMYRAKGLQGKLLEEVIEVLMADDNRLLRVMLEEELGLTLEAYEHPLKQAFGAAMGTLVTALFCIIGLYTFRSFGLPLCTAIVIGLAAAQSARLERNNVSHAVIWNLAIAGLTGGSVYFLVKFLP